MVGPPTGALDDQRGDVRSHKDARVPLGFDEGDIFSSSKPYSPPKHHVDSGGEEERANQQQRPLNNEWGPSSIVVMRTDTCAETPYFTYNCMSTARSDSSFIHTQATHYYVDDEVLSYLYPLPNVQ